MAAITKLDAIYIVIETKLMQGRRVAGAADAIRRDEETPLSDIPKTLSNYTRKLGI